MEKFHFNWKMDSFTSWLGLLGQCSTTLNACQAHWRGGRSGKSAPSDVVCSGTSEDKLVADPGWLAGMAFLFFLQFPSTQTLLIPTHKGWVYFTVPFGPSWGTYLGMYVCMYVCVCVCVCVWKQPKLPLTDEWIKIWCMSYASVQFSRSVVSDSLRPHEWQHARPPCPSPTTGVHSDSCPSSQ